MKPFVVLYATREGHTRRIAEYVGAKIVALGHTAEVHDVSALREPFDVYRYRGAIIAASIHGGRHETEMVEFVKRRTAQAEQKIAQAEAQAIKEVRATATDLAVAAATGLLAVTAKGPKGEALIAESIAAVKGKLN